MGGPRFTSSRKGFRSTVFYSAYSLRKKNKNLRQSFKKKAFVASVLAGWSYVAGLLQNHPERQKNLYELPPPTRECPDPLNAKGMSDYHHTRDEVTYRGLGTRTSPKDRQRMAQVFLAQSIGPNRCIDKTLMNQAVSTVIGLTVMKESYVKA